jgi:hypothetical protein
MKFEFKCLKNKENRKERKEEGKEKEAHNPQPARLHRPRLPSPTRAPA